MPGVQQIEHAVGEHDPAAALTPPPCCGGLGRADLGGSVQSGCAALGWKEKL